jgi:peroxiredoxin
MNRTISKFTCIAAFALALLAFSSCGNKKFHVNGNITDATDSTLYFENMSLDGPVVMDSIKLDKDGAFDFSEKATDAPEFYRLRIAGQIINISIDSTETVTVKASYPTMATNYSVEGSENCKKIKELALMQIDLQNRVIAIENNPNLDVNASNDSIDKVIEAYKTNVKMNYIFKEPMKAYAYFALFQSIGDKLIFNPRESRDDIKVYGAVATSWDTFYPKALRGQNLHNIAIEGMKDLRIVQQENKQAQIEVSKVNTTNIIDVALYDNKGKMRHLTDLKGKVVMLDFHVFASDGSLKRIMNLRSLYNKYHAKGLEIYQVSFDPDEHFWKTQTEALPWISVHDPDGMNSQYITKYNIQNVPTFFLIDKNNMLQKRDVQIKDLDAEIQKML